MGNYRLVRNHHSFGDTIMKKDPNILRIGFQNIGGFSKELNKLKDDIIRCGVITWEFDIFGFAETNVDWRLLPEEAKLHLRTREWFESLHISHSHNCTMKAEKNRQYGGVALFSMNQSAHRVINKGCDKSGLGRWTWTRYRGRNNQTLRIIVGYRPNPPAGPFTVYAQHRAYFNSQNDDRCPRVAFLQDLIVEVKSFKDEGDHIILLLDGNTDMKASDLVTSLQSIQLYEVILGRHGLLGPSTFKRNTNNTPIDGIWASPGIQIQAGGYFDYDVVFQGTDHRCLWIDITYITAFGHNMPVIIKPAARRLKCKDPRTVDNFIRHLKKFYCKHNILGRAQTLIEKTAYPSIAPVREEFESIDDLRCTAVRIAERKCRKLRMGQVAFSPEIQKAKLVIYAWSLLYKRANGGKVSSRLITRTLKKASIDRHMKQKGKSFAEEQLYLAHKYYYDIKGSHEALRITAMEQRAEALAAKGLKDKAKIVKELRVQEQQRNTAKKIKHIQGKLSRGSTTMVSIPDGPNSWVDVTGKEAIEQAILCNNEAKFKQSFHTPFYQPPLVHDFGFKGLSPFATLVLAGCYDPPENLDPYTAGFIQELKMTQAVKELGAQQMEISLPSHKKFWSKAKENTSCYPDDLSFATMKAGAMDDLTAEIDCLLTNIPLKGGFSPDRWKKSIDVMIQKKSGVTHLSGLRTIVLFPVDCNYAFKHVGREMMRIAEKAHSLAPEQYGSRKNHRAIDLAINKSLTYDLLRQLKRPGSICSNDAKSCYDLIGHTPASLAMQRQGVPKNIIDCLFSTLQNATHQVRTGYGDSKTSYGGKNWTIPMHGVGQGNGAGPAIWAVVSTPIINSLRRKGLGCEFLCPFSRKSTSFTGYAFVDDTDLIITNASSGSYQDVLVDLQNAVDTWEGGLKATGGAIVPDKTFVFVIDFKWSGGKWSYKRMDESPGSIQVNDIEGNRKEIKRYEVWEAQETLGVHLAPDGSTTDQAKKMIQIAHKWADSMRTGRIARPEAWIALTSTIWKTLTYPLSALNLTKSQCEQIMSPILRYALPALGICRNFPRHLVFAPSQYMGVGIQHLYTVQEISRIRDIITHTMCNSTTGGLYRNSLELFLLEVGTGTLLHEIPVAIGMPLATSSLIKSTWEFLATNKIQLHHDVHILPQREKDSPLMEVFLSMETSLEDKLALNRCRLYLHAYWISDIADGYGTSISDDAWLGQRVHIERSESWPRQGRPSQSDWTIWRQYLKRYLLQRGRRLKTSLGLWLNTPFWPWYISKEEDTLYHHHNSTWTAFPRVPRRTGRPIFAKTGVITIPPELLHNATVYSKGKFWVCSGHYARAPPHEKKRTDFQHFLAAVHVFERWCFENVQLVDNGRSIAKAISDRCAIAVSDGSFKDRFGTAAWVLEGDTSEGRIRGSVISPGGEKEHSPYRSELAGIYAVMKFVTKICEFYEIKEGSIEIACDGLAALNKAFSHVSILSTDDPSYDLLAAIKYLWAHSSLLWKIRHVHGHQDDHKAQGELDRWETLNIEVDAMAKSHIAVAKRRPRHFRILEEPWSIWIGDQKITKKLSNTIYEVVHSIEAREYWMAKRHLTSETFDSINWQAMKKAYKESTLSRRTFITKHTSGMCGVGKFMHLWKEKDNPNCPRCGNFEDADHVWVCQGEGVLETWETSLECLKNWLQDSMTDPDLQEVIISYLNGWRDGSTDSLVTPKGMEHLIDQQNAIGWNSFLLGWTGADWEESQQAYYKLIRSSKSGKRWVISLIKKLWEVAWDLWEHRNGILHDQNNAVSDKAISVLNQQIRSQYHQLQVGILEFDQYLLKIPLAHLLKKDTTYKRSWLQQSGSALSVARRNWWKAKQAKQRELADMQATMRNWLRSQHHR